MLRPLSRALKGIVPRERGSIDLEAGPPKRRAGAGGLARALLFVLVLVPRVGAARVFVTVDEAIRLAFPGCSLEKKTAYLKPEQQARAAALAGGEIASAVVNYQVATCAGKPGGTAYFDTHRVRTLPETLLIVLDPSSRVRRIEVVSFREPQDYLPRDAWYAQFLGRGLDPDLDLKRAIRPVTGATLTANATLAAVRRVLAIHQVLGPGAPKP